MEIVKLLIVNWDSVLVVLLAMCFVLWCIKKGQTKILKEIAYKLVTEAEKEWGSGTGELKKAAVIEWLYEKMPAILRVIFTKKDIENIIESVLKTAKENWLSNKNIRRYIEAE